MKRPRGSTSNELQPNCEVFVNGPAHAGNGLLQPGSVTQPLSYALNAPHLRDESLLVPLQSSGSGSSGRPLELYKTESESTTQGAESFYIVSLIKD